MQTAEAPATTRASLNFAADRTNGGIWSNATPEIITQSLESHKIEIRDARQLGTPPSLGCEGFQRETAPVERYDWTDQRWVEQVYMPHCVDLVRELTGAQHVVPLHNGILIRDTGDTSRAPAAEFVHLDQSRESAIPFLAVAADEKVRARYPRVKIFNVWRVITPPPQDVPLALCDQRTRSEADGVVGLTIEPHFPNGIAYVSSIFNPEQKWYYFSNLTTDDAIVFKGYDSDPEAPMGCLHGAFKLPEPPTDAVPRASAETRIVAFFED